MFENPGIFAFTRLYGTTGKLYLIFFLKIFINFTFYTSLSLFRAFPKGLLILLQRHKKMHYSTALSDRRIEG